VVCIRSFQLTQKASKMEYKAIESVLQTINPHTGEVSFWSARIFSDYNLCFFDKLDWIVLFMID
jgi:hypothetical protein